MSRELPLDLPRICNGLCCQHRTFRCLTSYPLKILSAAFGEIFASDFHCPILDHLLRYDENFNEYRRSIFRLWIGLSNTIGFYKPNSWGSGTGIRYRFGLCPPGSATARKRNPSTQNLGNSSLFLSSRRTKPLNIPSLQAHKTKLLGFCQHV